MDASLGALAGGASSGDAVSVKLLKKAQDMAASESQQLIESLPEAGGQNHTHSANPPGVGGSVDVTA